MDGIRIKLRYLNASTSALATMLGTFLWFSLYPCSAGTIAFDATASLEGSGNAVKGTLSLTLNSTESIYEVSLFGTGIGDRTSIGSVPLWEQHAAKNFQLDLPSPHRWPGKYHLLVDLRFRDQGGGLLNAALALDYEVRDPGVDASPRVIISGDQLIWSLGPVPPESATLTAATPHFGEWTFTPWFSDTTHLPLKIRSNIKLRSNWIYPQTARLDWIENDVHGSSAITWPMVTDERGHWRRTIDQDNPPNAQSKPLSVNAQSTLTATPARLLGEVTLTFTDSDAISDVEVSVLAQGIQTVATARPVWKPNEPLPVRFDVVSPHRFPGLYHLLMPIRYSDEQQHRYDAVVAIGYRVNRAGEQAAAPNVAIGKNQLTWQLGGRDPATVLLTLTTSPAWRSQPLHIPASSSTFALVSDGDAAVVPNWTYPQLARLDWHADGLHYSRILNWTMQTTDTGDWFVRGESTPGAKDDTVDEARPWWRQSMLLWIGAAGLVLAALVQSARQVRMKRKQSIGSNEVNPPHERPADAGPHD